MSLSSPAAAGPPPESAPGLDSPEPSEAAIAPLRLYSLEISLDTASLDALEAVGRAVSRIAVGTWFSGAPETEEAAVLSTCHRVEVALLVHSPQEVERWRKLLPGEERAWRLRDGRATVDHLFRVAAGRESLAVGEAEVRHQVRSAAAWVLSRHPRPVLREIFLGAADAADALFAELPPTTSIAAVAARRLLERVGRPHPRALVIGSGTVGRQVVERLAPFARVTIVYHQRPPDEPFLRATGARAVPLDRLAEELAVADAVVSAAKFGSHGLHARDLPRDHPVLLIDLGVPRNIDPEVRTIPGVRLVDLEELHALSPGADGPARDDPRVEALAERFGDRIERALLEPWIAAFRRAAEETRRDELANAGPYLGALEPGQRVAVERLTQRLVARLVRAPTERLRALPPGPEGDLRRRLAVELLRPGSDGP